MANCPIISGTMPAGDYPFTVLYSENHVIIDPIDDYDTPLG